MSHEILDGALDDHEALDGALAIDRRVFPRKLWMSEDELRFHMQRDPETGTPNGHVTVVVHDGKMVALGTSLLAPIHGSPMESRIGTDLAYLSGFSVRAEHRGHRLMDRMGDAHLFLSHERMFHFDSHSRKAVGVTVRLENMFSLEALLRIGETYRSPDHGPGSAQPGRSRFLIVAYGKKQYPPGPGVHHTDGHRLMLAYDYGTFIPDAATRYSPDVLTAPNDINQVKSRIKNRRNKIAIPIKHSDTYDPAPNIAAKKLLNGGYVGVACARLEGPIHPGGATHALVFVRTDSLPHPTALYVARLQDEIATKANSPLLQR